MTRITLSLTTLMATTNAALAHPADHHLSPLQSLVHLLTEPDHLAMIALAAVAAGAVWLARRRKAQ